MSIQLYSSPMKYKDPNTGNYTNIIGISGNPGRGIASVELNNDYTLTITFTDETSITTTSIRGNGIDTIEKTSTSGLIDTYTITDSDGGTYTFTVSNGMVPNLTIGTVAEGPVAAATITGTTENPVLNLVLPNANVPTRVSELENDAGYLTEHQDLSSYVQKTDYATSSKAGIIKPGSSFYMSGSSLQLNVPPDRIIQMGATEGAALTVAKQHTSTFYGLAKAAGDTTQSQSSNPVGTYTNEAKSAIQTMLDVPSNAAMQQAISNINTMKIHICTSEEYNAQTGVPTLQNPDTQTFYLVPGGESSNLFIEWVYVNNAWERFGSADIDLSGYATKEEVPVEAGSDVGSVQTKKKNGIGGNAIGKYSFAHGYDTHAVGYGSHSEGDSNAIGYMSHAEGSYVQAFGRMSHAEGSGSQNNIFTITDTANEKEYKLQTTASADNETLLPYIHGLITVDFINFGIIRQVEVLGNKNFKITLNQTIGSGYNNTPCKIRFASANGDSSHIDGYNLIADSDYQYAQGKNNVIDSNNSYVHIVGNGSAVNARSNAYALTWEGNGKYAGDVYVHANSDSSGGTKVATVDDIAAIEVPINDVQVNNVSVVDANGMANIPVASKTTFGTIKVKNADATEAMASGSSGGSVIVNGVLYTTGTNSDVSIKMGVDNAGLISTVNQHKSVFYGLAKVAGADMRNSSNAIGTYTEEAKTAIKSMLGVQDGLKVVRLI